MISKPGLFLLFISPVVLMAQPNNTTLDTGMVNASLNEKGELHIVPSANSSEKGFDSFYGSWNVTGRKLKNRVVQQWLP